MHTVITVIYSGRHRRSKIDRVIEEDGRMSRRGCGEKAGKRTEREEDERTQRERERERKKRETPR